MKSRTACSRICCFRSFGLRLTVETAGSTARCPPSCLPEPPNPARPACVGAGATCCGGAAELRATSVTSVLSYRSQLESTLALEIGEIEIVGKLCDFAVVDDEHPGHREHDPGAVVHGEVVDALGEYQTRLGRQRDDIELGFGELVKERLKDRADAGDAFDRLDRHVVVDGVVGEGAANGFEIAAFP